MAKKNVSHCNGCRFYNKETGINCPEFCEVGYTQNPKSVETTQNVLKNGAVVCSRNKFSGMGFKERNWSMAELLLSHPNSLNESMSEFKELNVNLSLYLN